MRVHRDKPGKLNLQASFKEKRCLTCSSWKARNGYSSQPRGPLLSDEPGSVHISQNLCFIYPSPSPSKLNHKPILVRDANVLHKSLSDFCVVSGPGQTLTPCSVYPGRSPGAFSWLHYYQKTCFQNCACLSITK